MGDNLKEIDWGSDFVIEQIAPCGRHTCALSMNNRVKCFGDNSNGQLGIGTQSNRGGQPGELGDDLPFVDLGSEFTPIQIDCGRYFTCALSTGGNVKCWGDNGNGQLGQGDTAKRGSVPSGMGDNLTIIDLGSDFNVSVIRCGMDHVCAMSTVNEIKCWGLHLFVFYVLFIWRTFCKLVPCI